MQFIMECWIEAQILRKTKATEKCEERIDENQKKNNEYKKIHQQLGKRHQKLTN